MSVPALLTALDTNDAATAVADSVAIATPVMATEDQIKSCASCVEAAAAIAPNYATTATANELDIIEEASPAASASTILRNFSVQLSTELEPNELIGLTGDAKALGEWKLERCVALSAQDQLKWSASVLLPTSRAINYRYFVYVQNAHGQKQIRRWESQLQPRTLNASDGNNQILNRLGEFGDAVQLNRGWLTNESIVQLKFEREKMFRVMDIDKFDPENVLIKLLPLKSDLATEMNATEAGIKIEVAKMKYAESLLQTQPSFGMSYKRGEIVIFHALLPNTLDINFALIFHTPEHKLIGRAVISATQLTGSEGLLELNIKDAFNADATVAQLSLPYVIVRPFSDAALDFRTTYAHYWPKSWPNLDVGHRGNGRSYLAAPPAEVENTIASFMRAYECFADMIELDVHLTKDGVPIIYHDFGVRTAPRTKQVTKPEQLEYVLIKDLSYEALKQLRVFAVINNEAVEYTAHNAEPRFEHRIFPRLVDVLKNLPKSLGIDVEIKWPQLRACGEPEALQTIDKNFFIDRVLATVITHGCGRPLIFSSFDADICTMIRFKQNLLPVMFLTMGETKKWSPFMDLRTRTFEQAINNAQAFELAGTAPHAEDFLNAQGAQMMQKAHAVGQITLVWGDDCNSKERVKYFNEIGATATCYDRADLYVPEGKERSFFNSSTLLAEFQAQILF